MDKATREIRHRLWEGIVKQCHARPQGQTEKQWLAEQGISDKTYYYWQKRLHQKAYDQMKKAELPVVDQNTDVTFAELSVPQDSGHEVEDPEDPASFHADAVSRTSQCTIAVSNSASEQLLKKILEVTRSC